MTANPGSLEAPQTLSMEALGWLSWPASVRCNEESDSCGRGTDHPQKNHLRVLNCLSSGAKRFARQGPRENTTYHDTDDGPPSPSDYSAPETDPWILFQRSAHHSVLGRTGQQAAAYRASDDLTAGASSCSDVPLKAFGARHDWAKRADRLIVTSKETDHAI